MSCLRTVVQQSGTAPCCQMKCISKNVSDSNDGTVKKYCRILLNKIQLVKRTEIEVFHWNQM
jgi:hypothetical protein